MKRTEETLLCHGTALGTWANALLQNQNQLLLLRLTFAALLTKPPMIPIRWCPIRHSYRASNSSATKTFEGDITRIGLGPRLRQVTRGPLPEGPLLMYWQAPNRIAIRSRRSNTSDFHQVKREHGKISFLRFDPEIHHREREKESREK